MDACADRTLCNLWGRIRPQRVGHLQGETPGARLPLLQRQDPGLALQQGNLPITPQEV